MSCDRCEQLIKSCIANKPNSPHDYQNLAKTVLTILFNVVKLFIFSIRCVFTFK